MNVEQIADERYNNIWWRARPRSDVPPDPQAHEHRRELLAALVGTAGGRRPSTLPVDDGDQAALTPAEAEAVSADEPTITGWKRTPLTPDELITEIEHLTWAGETPARIAERLGYKPASVATRLSRQGRRDLARPFWKAGQR